MKKTLQRVGALGLVTATVVTGLSFGPAATASETTASDTSQYARLVFQSKNGDWRYISETPARPGELSAGRAGTREEALREASIFEVPTADATGPVRGTGDKSNLCATGSPRANDYSRVNFSACDGSEEQKFTWAPVVNDFVPSNSEGLYLPALKLFVTSLSPYSDLTLQPEDKTSYMTATAVAASASYERSDDSVRFSITNGVKNADVYVEDLDGGNSNGGRDRTDGDGNASITLSGTGAGAGEYFRYKFGRDGTWTTVFTGRTGAIADLRVTREEGGRVRVSGHSSGEPNANIHVSRDRTFGSVVQTERASGYEFSFVLNEAATALDTAYVYSWSQGVRTAITIYRFTALVQSVDVTNRTAHLTGTASPHARIVVTGPTQGETRAGADGRWSYDVRELTPGTNSVRLEEYDGDGVKTAEATLDVVLEVAPLQAAVSFSSNLGIDATVSGSAQRGATVVIRDTAGVELARTTASTSTGAWSVSLPAPSRAGDYDVRIQQQIGGAAAGEITRTVAYGAGVQIESPTEGTVFDGGPVRMTGRGEPGARVTVREQGTTTTLGTATVLQNGTWSLTTTSLDNGRHVLEATQLGKGANTTTSTVTLNPEGAPVAPVAVTTPANPAEGYTPNTPFTFGGTGQAGSVVRVENASGTLYGQTTVTANGTWSWTLPFPGTATWNLYFVQDKGLAIESRATVLDFRPNTPPLPIVPVIVTNAGAGYTANTPFTFEGIGTIGKTIRVEDTSGALLGQTTVGDDNIWSWTLQNPGTKTWNLDFVQDKGLATQSTGRVRDFRPIEVPAPDPVVTVTNPADVTDGYTPDTPFTFEGTGAAGKTIRVENENGTLYGQTTVTTNGTWSWTLPFPGTATWNLYFVQDKGLATESRATVLDFRPNTPPVPSVPVSVTNPTDVGAGYTPNTPFIFEGLGTPGKTIRVEDTSGTLLGQTTVGQDDAWTWTLQNPGTATWNLDFVQDKGLATESRATVRDFRPIETPVPAPLVTVTNPANIADGYTPNAPFTFEGTGTPGKIITVTNRSGTPVQTPVRVRTDGTWSFFRANMGTSTYYLNFTQDQGLPTETSTRVWGFAPKAAPAPVVTVTNPADVADGYRPNAPFTFEGTGTPGKTITVTNRSGTPVQTPVRVRTDGTWSFFRANMGTSTYYLNFTQDKGLPTEVNTRVWGFAPNAAAPAVTLTAPANPALGYTPNTSYTFKGTGTPGSSITVVNKYGSNVQDPTTVKADGTWEWTRANMGTSIWFLSFVQDQGLPTEVSTPMITFAPTR